MASQSLKQKYSTSEEVVMGGVNALTAHAGGGQGAATPMTAKWNRFDTIATDLNSGLLKAALVGMKQVAFNNTAATTNKILSIYPQTGEKINGVINKRCDISPGLCGIFESPEDGNWYFKVGKLEDVFFEATVNLSTVQISTLRAAPVDCIPAPGVGLAIELIAGYCEYTYGGGKTGGSPFYTGPALFLFADTAYSPATADYQMSGPVITAPNSGSGPQFSTPYTERSLFTRNGVSCSYINNGFQGGKRIIENKKIRVTSSQDAVPPAAWGTAKLNLVYRIVTL